MAATGICKPAMVLGLVVAALVMAAAQAATVTIYNPAGMVVNLQLQDDTQNQRVEMTTAMMSMEIPQEQQNMQISQAGGEVVDVSVRDGDVLVLIPDPTDDSGKVIMAFKVVEEVAAAGEPKASSVHEDMAAAGEPRASSSVDTATDIPPPFWDRAYSNRKMATGPAAAILEDPKLSGTASIPAYDRAYNARLLDPVRPPGFD